jgi:ATP-dependent DNA ligase
VLDGEPVVWHEGTFDFPELQRRIVAPTRTGAGARRPATLLAFDLPAVVGQDIRRHPLRARRQELDASWQ